MIYRMFRNRTTPVIQNEGDGASFSWGTGPMDIYLTTPTYRYEMWSDRASVSSWEATLRSSYWGLLLWQYSSHLWGATRISLQSRHVLLFINDTGTDIRSRIRLLADDTIVNRAVDWHRETERPQEDLRRHTEWSHTKQIRVPSMQHIMVAWAKAPCFWYAIYSRLLQIADYIK